ncbi:hypothetical protein, partial [Acinetobacter baumannii]|uniref:hypothetical protein n=1 Tax=Acinetobacter baumannii TaxID=470 RepID=UPI0039F0AD56
MPNKTWAASVVAAIVSASGTGSVLAQEVQLPETKASGQRQAPGFRAKETSVATRTDADVMDSAFAVSCV